MLQMISVPLASVLVAPYGVLSGDGQLEEVLAERLRTRDGNAPDIWHLSPDQLEPTLKAELQQRGVDLGTDHAAKELLLSTTPHLLLWLQLRFGGDLYEHLPLRQGTGYRSSANGPSSILMEAYSDQGVVEK